MYRYLRSVVTYLAITCVLISPVMHINNMSMCFTLYNINYDISHTHSVMYVGLLNYVSLTDFIQPSHMFGL